MILATSVDVECTFSQSWLLSHVCSHLLVQSRCVLLCIGVWSVLGYVKDDDDVKAVAVLPEVNSEEDELAVDWDDI